MSGWRADPTFSKEEALAAFAVSGVDEAPQLKHQEDISDASTLEDYLSSVGLDRDVSGKHRVSYIVIGGGTAGLAVAARLADSDPNISVCVIEAGIRREDPLIDVPGLYGISNGDRDYDWAYKTIPQPELNNREIASSAGRILGGSSAINFLVRMRASSPEYDAWSNFGAGWDWEGLLPFFQKEECYVAPKWGTDEIFPGITRQQDEEARQNEPKFRGNTGPVHSTHNSLYTDLLEPTIEALNNLGVHTNRTPGYGDSTGMFNIDNAVNRANGRRSYAANSYTPTSAKRDNLKILPGLCATRMLFRPGENAGPAIAIGVEFVSSDPRHRFPQIGTIELRPGGEVILSAGAYNTPRLLELSGIGNPTVINRFGIDTIVDLPGVGENLQEHPFLITDFTVKEGVFTLDRLRIDPEYKQAQLDEYKEKGTGAFATTVAAYGFIKLDRFLSSQGIEELKTELDDEIEATPTEFHKQQLKIRRGYLERKDVGDVEIIMVPKVFASEPRENTSYVTLCASLPHTVSRGTVHITSRDALAPPAIDPQYLTSAFDTKVLVKATEFLRKITQTKPLCDMVDAPSSPPASVATYKDFEDHVRNNTVSIYHPVGTASMAPRELGGVVDAELRVHGTANLRVVDMSIVPLHIAAHTADTAYAIGEKAFTIIQGKKRV